MMIHYRRRNLVLSPQISLLSCTWRTLLLLLRLLLRRPGRLRLIWLWQTGLHPQELREGFVRLR